MTDKCQRCNEEQDDLRTLFMSCFYEMNELELPFEIVETGKINSYTLRVCKRCRSDWLHFIRMWFHIKLPEHNEVGSGIFIRDFGHNREVSEEKFREMYPGQEPVRINNND